MLILNIILGVLIIALILLQGRGAGLGSAWGGGGELYQTRRGIAPAAEFVCKVDKTK
jgi:protein translocase SecG subunit